MANTDSVLLATYARAGRKETDDTINAIRDMIEQFKLLVTQIHFPAASYAPAAGVRTQTVVVETADNDDKRMLFGDNKVDRVQVQRNSGTAAGPALTGAEGQTGTAITVKLHRGQASFVASATGAGTIVIGLTDVAGSGLIVTDTVTVTFS